MNSQSTATAACALPRPGPRVLEPIPAEIVRQAIANFQRATALNNQANDWACSGDTEAENGTRDYWSLQTACLWGNAEQTLIRAILGTAPFPGIHGKLRPERFRWPACAVACGSIAYLVLPDPKREGDQSAEDEPALMILAVIDRTTLATAILDLDMPGEVAAMVPAPEVATLDMTASSEWFQRVMGGGQL